MVVKTPYGSRTGTQVRWICLCLASFLLLVAGCAPRPLPPVSSRPPPSVSPGSQRPYRVGRHWYCPMADAHGFCQRGLASWYGKDFNGKKTASGETYNMYGMTAAHKTLPLGTWVQVTNLKNGKSATVRINDRGPFVRNRIIDLSYKAAKVLGVVGPGTATVEVRALGRLRRNAQGKRSYAPEVYDRGRFTIQVGAFRNRDNAERLVRQLSRRYQNAHMVSFDSGAGVFYRVRVGHLTSLEKARSYEDQLIQNGFPQATIVAE